MLKNFTVPAGEQPIYYSTTVEDGTVVRHDGDPQHAVYKSVMDEIRRRSDRWHEWVAANHPGAYDHLGIIDPDVFMGNLEIHQQFLDGER